MTNEKRDRSEIEKRPLEYNENVKRKRENENCIIYGLFGVNIPTLSFWNSMTLRISMWYKWLRFLNIELRLRKLKKKIEWNIKDKRDK